MVSGVGFRVLGFWLLGLGAFVVKVSLGVECLQVQQGLLISLQCS